MAQDLRFEDKPGSPFHISADKIEYDTAEDLYIARGNVTITKNGNTVSADTVRYHPKTKKASASGHVILTSKEDILTGSHMDLDMGTETGSVSYGNLFLNTNHFYITGDSIQKVDKEVYTAEHATVTTCDGESPTWKMTVKHLDVTLEGYGYATHATLWIRNIPVLYTPFLPFPVKTNRQSGLLTPQVDYSDRLGFALNQPLFWAINDHSDATFYAHYLSRRGTKTGLEYRYILDPLSKGTMMVDVLTDRKLDDGRLNSSRDWGYEDDDLLRPNGDRYWFRMKHDHALGNGFFAELDIDIVSDQDYLYEFKDGYTGYKETNDYYNDTFGRILDRSDDPIRANRLNFNKSWIGYKFNSELLWYDDVIKRRQGGENISLQQLPFVEFSMLKQPLFNSLFYQDFNAAYAHFYREKGTRGHRLDTYMRFYIPYRVKNALALESSLGLRETIWHMDHYENLISNEDRTLLRGIYDLRLDLSTEFYRIFNSSKTPGQRIKHMIRPQILYEYTPNLSQDQYPSFDTLDRIPEENLLTYSIDTLFISRSEKKGEVEQHQKGAISNIDYRQFFRLELEQQYDILKANQDDPEPFSPIGTRLEFIPTDYFMLDVESQWSIYQNRFISRNASMNVHDDRGDRLFVEYRYTRDDVAINPVESINTAVDLYLFEGFTVYGSYEHNIYDGKRIKQEMGLLYERQCWLMDLRYWEEENNFKIRFSFKLKGLGDAGT